MSLHAVLIKLALLGNEQEEEEEQEEPVAAAGVLLRPQRRLKHNQKL